MSTHPFQNEAIPIWSHVDHTLDMLDRHIKGLGVRINGSYEFQFAGKLKGTGKNGLSRKLKHEIAKNIGTFYSHSHSNEQNNIWCYNKMINTFVLILVLMNKKSEGRRGKKEKNINQFSKVGNEQTKKITTWIIKQEQVHFLVL